MIRKKHLWFLFAPVLALTGSCSEERGNRDPAAGNRGVVVSIHPTASQIGLDVLKQGGMLWMRPWPRDWLWAW